MSPSVTYTRNEIIAMPDVKIGKTTYKVDVWHHEWVDHVRDDAECSNIVTVLTSPRGTQYKLTPVRHPYDGVCRLYSLGSGRELRKQGNAVRVVHIGDIIEAL